LQGLISWQEQHPVTVQLITWFVVLVLAWAVGLFKWLRRQTQKPRFSIVPTASRCLLEEFDELEGKKDVVRASFLINAAVANRSSEKIVIEAFEFTFRRRFAWKRYGPKLGPVSLPNIPRKKMGSGEKYMGVFFTNFSEGDNSLTVTGRLEPKDFSAGYLLFVAFTFGSWNPLITEKGIKVHLIARLTTGERIKTFSYIPIVRDKQFFEDWVPGIIEQISHETA